MTAITQKIPNFIGGISQQPDELKPEGSLREALNVIPDVTDGLSKRPGSRLVNPLTTEMSGSWFHINYSDTAKYIGKVNFNGEVNIFNCSNGLAEIVEYAEYDPSEESNPDNNPSSGYPDCVIADYNASKIDMNEKEKLYDKENAKYNAILEEKLAIEEEASAGDDVKEIYRVDEVVIGDTVGKGRVDLVDGVPVYNKNNKDTKLIMIRGLIKHSGGEEQYPEEPPEGYTSLKRGDRMMSDTTIEANWNGKTYENADLYELKAFNKAKIDQRLRELQDELEDQMELVEATKAQYKLAIAAYEAQAASCGLINEYNDYLKSLIETDVVPEYLVHDIHNQIRSVVIGNRVFLINPEVPTGMNQSQFEPRDRENFIEVTTAAGMQDYSLELIAEDTSIESYTVVTEVDVIDGEFKGSDGSCPYQTTSGPVEETFDDGDKVDLTIALSIQGQRYLNGNGNSESDWDCKYFANAEIINGGKNWKKGDIVKMETPQRPGKNYKIKVKKVEERWTSEGELINVPATGDGVDSVIKPSDILNDIVEAITAKDDQFTCKIIGNGVWVTHADPDYVWRFAAINKALMTVTTDQVTSITQLPTQCRAGYTVKVTNTEEREDDYYAAFQTRESGIDGPGAWVETYQPGIATYINPGSMPHQISRQPNGQFIVSPVEWEPRLVGDNITNPKPSFLSKPEQNEVRTIENMILYRNRLCILSGDTVSCSRAGDYFNFWHQSALTIADNDPVDLSCGSTASSDNAVLTDAIEIGQGLVCFTGGDQYVLNSGSESFTPSNAKFSHIGSYRHTGYQPGPTPAEDVTAPIPNIMLGIRPFSLGTSVGFLADAGLNSRLLEMFNIGQNAEASVNELTKPVSRLVPYGINLLADSRDNNLIVLSRVHSNELWVYRYFDNDKNRLQSAWFKWQLPAPLAYHCIMDDVYWSISYSYSDSAINAGKPAIVALQRIDLKDNLATAFVYDKYVPSAIAGDVDIRKDNDLAYQAHLDNYRIAQPSENTYYNHIDQTYFRAPIVHYKALADAGGLRAYLLSPTPLQSKAGATFSSIGSSIPIRVEEDTQGTWFVMDGDWSESRMMIGYVYNMQVNFPTLYPSKTQNTSVGPVTTRDTRSYLNLHRVKVNFGQVGVYQTELSVLGRDKYEELYECKTMDDYPANEVAFDQRKTQTIPVYAKNTDMSLIIKSPHPSPCTIHSLEWEGDYGAKWYRRA